MICREVVCIVGERLGWLLGMCITSRHLYNDVFTVHSLMGKFV